jgi:integrase
LDSCDKETVIGKRDYALLLLLARLGLRAGEVVALPIDDIDWEAGLIAVCGKGKRVAQMPLTSEVGAAIADYLSTARPQCSSRHVFIRTNAPLNRFRQLSRHLLAGRPGAHKGGSGVAISGVSPVSALCRVPDYAAGIKTECPNARRRLGCMRASRSTCGIVQRLWLRVV